MKKYGRLNNDAWKMLKTYRMLGFKRYIEDLMV